MSVVFGIVMPRDSNDDSSCQPVTSLVIRHCNAKKVERWQ